MIRRKKIPDWIKRKVLKRQYDLCDCGCRKAVTIESAEFDHDPPLELRAWDEKKRDTIPAANDPDYLFALAPACHREKTYSPRGPHTSIDSDRHSIDKARRIRNGGRKRKGLPVPGSIDSPWKKPFSGDVEFRRRDRGDA